MSFPALGMDLVLPMAFSVSLPVPAPTSPSLAPAPSSRGLGLIEMQWLRRPDDARARDFMQELQSLFAALEGVQNALSPLAAVTTREDATRLYEAALLINPLRAEELVLRFFEQ